MHAPAPSKAALWDHLDRHGLARWFGTTQSIVAPGRRMRCKQCSNNNGNVIRVRKHLVDRSDGTLLSHPSYKSTPTYQLQGPSSPGLFFELEDINFLGQLAQTFERWMP